MRRSTALTTRLALGYTLGVIATLSVVAFFLHRSLRRSFELEDAELLSDNISVVRKEALRRKGDLHEVEEIIHATAGERQVEKYYGRLIDAEGKVLMETPGIRKLSPTPSSFPDPAPIHEAVPKLHSGQSPDGVPLFMASAKVDIGSQHPPLTYQVVFDASHVETWLKQFDQTLFLMIGVAITASLAVGWLVARRGLSPLRDITATVQRVTATGLNERLGTRPWPRELVTLAAEFDHMLGRLRVSFDRLSQFTADAAHEFRTPLNNLLGATSLQLSRDRSPEEYREALEANVEEYERLSRMVERLLFLARADHSPSILNRQNLNAGDLARDVVDFFSALGEERGVTILVTGQASISADETLIRQALTNLISNALRYTSSGGTVNIIITRSLNDEVEISISDTGCGIPEEHLPRLFDRFYQVDSARGAETNPRGSGLGLALVKSVMALHGGEVSVESEVNKGTIFHLRFPPPPPNS